MSMCSNCGIGDANYAGGLCDECACDYDIVAEYDEAEDSRRRWEDEQDDD